MKRHAEDGQFYVLADWYQFNVIDGRVPIFTMLWFALRWVCFGWGNAYLGTWRECLRGV